MLAGWLLGVGCGQVGFDRAGGPIDASTGADDAALGPPDAQLAADRCDRAAPAVPAPTGRVWYVDPAGSDLTGTGGAGAPYATLDGLGTLPQPGDQVRLRPGVYGRQRVGFDGSQSTPISITVEGQAGAEIDGSDVTGAFEGALDLDGRHDLIVDGLLIRDSGERGVTADFATRITLQNLTILRSATDAVVIGGTGHLLDHNELLDSGTRHAGGDGSAVGTGLAINWNTAGQANQSLVIRRNRIAGVWGFGITASHVQDLVVSDNVLVDIAWDAVVINRGRSVVLTRNVIAHEGAGYRFTSGAPNGLLFPIAAVPMPSIEAPFTTPSQDLVIHNNLLRGVRWGVGTYCDDGLPLADAANATWANVEIAHNTFVDVDEPISTNGRCAQGPVPTSFVAVANVALRSPGALAGPWLVPSYNCWEASTGTLTAPTDLPGPCGLRDDAAAGVGAFAPMPAASVLAAGPAGNTLDDLLCRPRSPSAPSVGAYEAPLDP